MDEEMLRKRREHRENDPLSPVLRAMEVNETRSWPAKRRFTVNATKWQVEVKEDKKFIQRTCDGRVYVTRIR